MRSTLCRVRPTTLRHTAVVTAGPSAVRIARGLRLHRNASRPLPPSVALVLRASGPIATLIKIQISRYMTLLSVPIKANTRLGNPLHKYKQTITLNQIQKEVFVGTLLSNASMPLNRSKARAARWKPLLSVKFVQTIARAEYIQHLSSVFYDFVSTPPRGRSPRDTLVPPGFINLCGFELLVTLISNFMTKRRTSSIQPMPPKGEVVAGRKEFQKILVNY